AEIHPSDAECAFELARCALEHGDLDLAEQTYRTLLLALHHARHDGDGAPSRAEVYLDLSEIAARRWDTERAEDLIESAFGAALESEVEARRLEKALLARGQPALLVRALEGRLSRAASPA